MTTNLIAIAFVRPRGQVAVSACPTSALPRVPAAFPMADAALVDGWPMPVRHKSTGVSVPGCRGTT